MLGFILPFIVSIIFIVIGISNIRGNISSLHSYHRNRVSPQDVIPYGRCVGIGMIIIAIGMIIFSIFSAIAFFTEIVMFSTIGTVFLIIGLVVGLIIVFGAMIKYNKGIF